MLVRFRLGSRFESGTVRFIHWTQAGHRPAQFNNRGEETVKRLILILVILIGGCKKKIPNMSHWVTNDEKTIDQIIYADGTKGSEFAKVTLSTTCKKGQIEIYISVIPAHSKINILTGKITRFKDDEY